MTLSQYMSGRWMLLHQHQIKAEALQTSELGEELPIHSKTLIYLLKLNIYYKMIQYYKNVRRAVFGPQTVCKYPPA